MTEGVARGLPGGDALVAFAEAHAEADDARVVSVAFDDSAAAIEKFFRERGGGWPVLAMRTGHIAVDWGVIAVPESYLVSPSGHVAAKVVGGIELAELELQWLELQAEIEKIREELG